jgi:hypothetical protein
MASFAKTNGSTQPVFAIDVRDGSIAQSANIAAQGPVQMQGPKLDFFSLVANASVASQGGVNGYVGNVLTAIQNGTGAAGGQGGCTIAMYEIGSDATTINLAIYPTGAYTTATLVAAAQVANGTIGIDTANVAATATFTNTQA